MTPTPTDRLRQWLAEQMRARRLSQAQVALRSGVDRSTVGRIISGDRSPTLDTAVRLLAAFDHEALPDGLRRTLRPVMDPSAMVADALRGDPRLPGEAVLELLVRYRALRTG